MKLDRLNEYVLITTVMAVGILLAIFCGRLAGTGDQMHIVLYAAAAVAIIVCLWLRTKIWLLIPTFWVMSGQMNSLPGHLPVRDLVIGGVVLFFLSLKAFKMIRVRPVVRFLDIFMWINVLYLVTVFLRRPVGVHAFGTELVGGRPYLEVIFAVMGYWVLNQVIMTPFQSILLPVLFSGVGFFIAFLSTLAFFFPFLTPIIGGLYSGISAQSYLAQQNGPSGNADDQADTRMQFLQDVASSIFNLLCSFLSPLLFFNPLYTLHWKRFPLIYIRPFTIACIAFYFCLKSGHRTTIPVMLFTLYAAAYFRKGIAGIVFMAVATLPPLVILVALQGNLYQLPETAQRTLCFLPGKWNQNVLLEAKGSSDWRFQMWDIVLHEEKYIHNKTFGDGFGFTERELEDMAAVGSQEDFMIIGDVHSGPVSAIHVVGFVGLALFIILRIICCYRAWKLIRASQGTPFFPYSLFVGIPTLYGSIGFVFIFGDYKNDFPGTIMTIAFLNLCSNGLVAYHKALNAPAPLIMPKPPVIPHAPIPIPAAALER